MNINPDLLEKVQKENKEFRGLYRENTTHKNKVEALKKKKILLLMQFSNLLNKTTYV